MKTTRKKMLLSSIAMLLVALVALGSATYAWFTQNKTVTASGFTGKASSAIGLKILSESDAAANSLSTSNAAHYKTSTTLYTGQTDKVLSPVSMVPNAGAFTAFETAASLETDYARDLTKAVTGVTAPTSYTNGSWYVEKVYVVLTGNSGASTTKNFGFDSLTAAWGNDAIAGAGRVSIAYHDASGNDTLIGKYAKAAEDTTEINSTVAANTAISASNSESVSYTALAVPNGTYSVSDSAGSCYFTIAVWLDGQDDQCKTSNITASSIVSNIAYQLTLAD